jgi:hypothetical protein
MIGTGQWLWSFKILGHIRKARRIPSRPPTLRDWFENHGIPNLADCDLIRAESERFRKPYRLARPAPKNLGPGWQHGTTSEPNIYHIYFFASSVVQLSNSMKPL